MVFDELLAVRKLMVIELWNQKKNYVVVSKSSMSMCLKSISVWSSILSGSCTLGLLSVFFKQHRVFKDTFSWVFINSIMIVSSGYPIFLFFKMTEIMAYWLGACLILLLLFLRTISQNKISRHFFWNCVLTISFASLAMF